MLTPIYARQTVSVTELKRNLSSILGQVDADPIAVLNHNKPEAYLISARRFEEMMNKLEDLEDILLATARLNTPTESTTLDDLLNL